MSDDDQVDGLGDLPSDSELEILYRLDERTERIDARIERMDGRLILSQQVLDNHDDRIQRNTTILNALTFGLGAAITTILGRLGGIIKF